MMRLVGIALAAAMVLAGAPAAFAEHLPEGQSSPCRPNAPAGESTVGYSDAGPQDDPQRQLPTIYYNDTGQFPYIGVCGGGSDGEPIRYIEIRVTPAGPYLYASDTAGGTPLAQCVPALGAVGISVGRTCANTGIPADARNISADASTATDGVMLDYFATSERDEYGVSVTQDRVALQTSRTTTYEDFDLFPARYDKEFFVERDEATGRIEVGTTETAENDWDQEYGTCTMSVSGSLTDPGSVTVTNDDPNGICDANYFVSLVQSVLDNADEYAPFVLEQVGNAVDALPEGPPGPANCRQNPRPGEQSMALPGSAIVYWNTASAYPYAGVCAGGSGGYPLVWQEVVNTPQGPYVFGTVAPSVYVPAEVTVPDTGSGYSSHYSIAVDQGGVHLKERRSYGGYDESYGESGVRRTNGEIQYYEHQQGYSCDYGRHYAVSLTDPGPPTYHDDTTC